MAASCGGLASGAGQHALSLVPYGSPIGSCLDVMYLVTDFHWRHRTWQVRAGEPLARQQRAVAEASKHSESVTEYSAVRVLLSRQTNHLGADLAFLEELRSDLKAFVDQRRGAREDGPGRVRGESRETAGERRRRARR